MAQSDLQDAEAPRRIGFLLLNGFPLMAYASIVEAFRAANVSAGRDLYRWIHISPDGGVAIASNQANILTDAAVGDAIDIDTIFVVAGQPTGFAHKPTFAWLRRLAVTGVRIGGVSGGPFILARAGLLEGYRCTVHWYYVPDFLDRFPTHALEDKLYVIDRNRLTCAGGTAGLDLATDIIQRDHGHELAVEVGQWFIRTQSRPAEDAQRVSLRERYNVSSPRILKALAHMEKTIEDPDDRSTLARVAGVSVRQLERLFKLYLHVTIGEMHRRIRLDHAQTLLRKTAMTITDVAIASGFTSCSHFSKSYKSRFGHSPRQGRIL